MFLYFLLRLIFLSNFKIVLVLILKRIFVKELMKLKIFLILKGMLDLANVL